MTNDFTPDVAATGLPSLLQQGVASAARAGLNALAGMLASAGVLSGDQTTQFVTVGVALVTWGATWVWSQVKNRNAHKAVKTALVTPAPGQGFAGTAAGPIGSRR